MHRPCFKQTNFYFPCFHKLDRFLNPNFVPDHDQSSVILNHYPQPTLSLLPLKNYISVFLHHAIITAYLHTAKPSQSASSNAVPNVIKAQTLPQFWRRLPILQDDITHPFYHSRIIVLQPPKVGFFQCPSFTTIQHDTSYTCLVLPILWTKEDTPTRAGKRSLNFLYPDLVLAITLSSVPPPALIISTF